MHNHRSLFNMDISGGLPAVVIKMLVASDPGRVRLLPALPSAWPEGTIEGVLCRGQIEIERLRWDSQAVDVELRSQKAQTIVLELPFPIRVASVEQGEAEVAETGQSTQRRVTLPAGESVRLKLSR
jgi:hypothetical protein